MADGWTEGLTGGSMYLQAASNKEKGKERTMYDGTQL